VTSFIPLDKMPHLYESAFRDYRSLHQRIVGTDYPYFLTHLWRSLIAHVGFSLLNKKPKLTTDDFRAISR